jgi:phenylalanyl-tRNA synthetase beta chain
MKLPLSLIQSFIHTDLSPAKIGDTLTLLGIEVDRIENEQPPFANVIVAEVLTVKKHPDSKNLQIAEVNDGKAVHQVVCGAPNCRAGMKTAFAPVGAVLTDANGMEHRIEKTSIRGIESNGMLCSGAELKISESQEGILELPFELKNGADALPLLWDPLFELSLTPNLGHCMSALGIARELSASLQIPIQKAKKEVSAEPLKIKMLLNDFSACPRYSCCLIEGLQTQAAPFWLKRQLEACGQKSINAIVDIANYIMLKNGQPLHAFDYDLIEGETIQISRSTEPVQFLGLDGIQREVPAGTLLISDAKKPVAIAGIMGGANSAVSEKTTRILLEAAYFDPILIRTASKKMGLRTESSQRFEKGIDPNGVQEALFEAAQLIGGSLKGSIDLKKESFKPKEIAYRTQKINHALGTHLSETEIENILQRLGFQTKKGKAEVPLYRFDISSEVDLIEEVARIYGYNHIPKVTPRVSTSRIPHDPVFLFENEFKAKLIGLGLTEFLCCDLISPKLADICHLITPEVMGFLKASYSKSEEYSILRTSLLPGLLQVTQRNFSQKNPTFSAFEMGRIHFTQDQQVVEIPMAAILLTGKREKAHWSHKPSDIDYFDLKGMIENLLQGSFSSVTYQSGSTHLSFHPGRQADIHIGDLIVGSLGEVHPTLLEKFNIEQRVFYAELNLLHLLKMKKTHIRMIPLPQFPASERDWTIPLPPETPIDQIFQAIHSVKSPLLTEVDLKDLYTPNEGEQKRATFRFIYRDLFKTISSEEVEMEHAKMMQAVGKLLAK